jgi:predicted  nucleic acid-binding Zn-ribbon protein
MPCPKTSTTCSSAGACPKCGRRSFRYVRTGNDAFWFVCDRAKLRAGQQQHRTRWLETRPPAWPDWKGADGLLTAQERVNAPMAWSDAELLAYRERLLREFEEVAPMSTPLGAAVDQLHELDEAKR